ncbi:MAG TPA: SH3 domain-containing protein [Rhodocyclaceae bacterium]|nr:SH3 domain-containing protein [Rhodocyclaceae bacterium]
MVFLPRPASRLPAAALAAAICVLPALSGPACALDYKSVGEPAILYDAPSQKAQPLFVIARGTPVEVVVVIEGWLKVRDGGGDLAWIEKKHLADRRTVMVRGDRAQVRAQADEKAPLVFEAEKNVILDLLEPGPAGWARVRHRDGQEGYVRTPQVWGL